MKLIDISAWQTNIDWNAVSREFEGVIIKIGESLSLDKMFITHVNNAVAHGLKYGIYYYTHARNDQEALQDSYWVNAQVKTYLNGKCPELGIWYDAEDNDMRQGNVTSVCSSFVASLNSFGYSYVGIYSSYSWFHSRVIDMNALADYVPYWVAQYYRECSLKEEYPNKHIRIWQYTDHYSAALPYDANIYYC